MTAFLIILAYIILASFTAGIHLAMALISGSENDNALRRKLLVAGLLWPVALPFALGTMVVKP